MRASRITSSRPVSASPSPRPRWPRAIRRSKPETAGGQRSQFGAQRRRSGKRVSFSTRSAGSRLTRRRRRRDPHCDPRGRRGHHCGARTSRWKRCDRRARRARRAGARGCRPCRVGHGRPGPTRGAASSRGGGQSPGLGARGGPLGPAEGSPRAGSARATLSGARGKDRSRGRLHHDMPGAVGAEARNIAEAEEASPSRSATCA